MIILSIETSCDETGVSVLKTTGNFPHAHYEILGNALFSQTDIHREYGGVFPAVAKREHAKTLVPMLKNALGNASLGRVTHILTREKIEQITQVLRHEPGLADALFAYLEKEKNERGEYYGPPIDLIAVTSGPGLEPALWVGINFAKALALAWDVVLAPVNHMEGHVFVSLFAGEEARGASARPSEVFLEQSEQKYPEGVQHRYGGRLAPVIFPALALLISGGHTELALMKKWNEYALVGQTRDDAVGEAFDKVARMLGLPYPGGPRISRLAEAARAKGVMPRVTLPRPMLTADNCDFSFSGLKTAVLYVLKKYETITAQLQKEVALEFENATADVLVAKTKRAMDTYDAQTLILGGGVSANTHIRRVFTALFSDDYPKRTLYLPDPKLTTDNAVMIALAAHARVSFGETVAADDIIADGNLSLHAG